MKRKIGRSKQPIEVKKNDENSHPNGFFPRKENCKKQKGPAKTPWQNFKKAIDDSVLFIFQVSGSPYFEIVIRI